MDKEIGAKTIESEILVYTCVETSLQRAPDTFKNHLMILQFTHQC